MPSWPSGCWANGPTPCWCAISPPWTKSRRGTRSSSRARSSSCRPIPGPSFPASAPPLDERLRAEGPAAPWVRAALAGSQVLDEAGHVLRRASGAIFLGGAAAPSGPLRRRAELETLGQEAELASIALGAAEASLSAALARLAQLEGALAKAPGDRRARARGRAAGRGRGGGRRPVRQQPEPRAGAPPTPRWPGCRSA